MINPGVFCNGFLFYGYGKLTFESETIGVVCPVYGHEMPDMVKEFLGKAVYINTVKMVDNFLPGFDMDEQIATEPEKKIEEHIEAIKADIDSRKCWKQPVTQEDRDWHRQFPARQTGRSNDF